MAGVKAWIGGRTVLVETPAVMSKRGVPVSGWEPNEGFFTRVRRMPGFRSFEGPLINGIYAVTFDDGCPMPDEVLVREVARAANLSRGRA